MKFIKKTLRYALLAWVLIVSALFLFSRFEHWRGHKVWKETYEQLRSQGVTANWANYIPEPVSDEKNFALSSIMSGCFRTSKKWSEIGQWREDRSFGDEADTETMRLTDLINFQNEARFGYVADVFERLSPEVVDDIRDTLQPYRARLKELRAASSKYPESYLPGSYEVSFESPIPAFELIRAATRLLYFETLLALESGQSDLLLQNCKVMKRLANLNPQVPLLINVMIENVVWRNHITEALAAGIQRDIFDEDQLLLVISLSGSVDMVSQLGASIEAEFAASIDGLFHFLDTPVETMRNFGSEGTPLLLGQDVYIPDDLLTKIIWNLTPAEGWNLIMASKYMGFAGEYMFENIDQELGLINMERFDAMEERLEELINESSFFDGYIKLVVPSYQRVSEVALDAQRRIDLIHLAATLSLRAKRGEPLPDSLAESTIKLPTDPSTLEPYTFERRGRGFRISSPGMDESFGSDDDLILSWKPST